MPMVSPVEKQTPPNNAQHCTEEEKDNSEPSSFHEVYQKNPAEKSIISVQVCLRCGRKLPFKKGRKTCPSCERSLITETIVLRTP
jgi:ribosomal protein L40E